MQGQSKKLAEAARLLARGLLRIPGPDDAHDSPNAQIDEALAAVGLFAEQPLQLEEEYVLWPECVPVFDFWFVVQTQWHRTGEAGVASGLNYTGVESCMNMRGVPTQERPELLSGLQVMELATLKVWRERRG